MSERKTAELSFSDYFSRIYGHAYKKKGRVSAQNRDS